MWEVEQISTRCVDSKAPENQKSFLWSVVNIISIIVFVWIKSHEVFFLVGYSDLQHRIFIQKKNRKLAITTGVLMLMTRSTQNTYRGEKKPIAEKKLLNEMATTDWQWKVLPIYLMDFVLK